MKCYCCGCLMDNNSLKCQNCGFVHPGYTGDKNSYEKTLALMGKEYRKANNVSIWRDNLRAKTVRKLGDSVLDEHEWLKACDCYEEAIKRSREHVFAYFEKLQTSSDIGIMSKYAEWLANNYEKDEVQKLLAGIIATVFSSSTDIPSDSTRNLSAFTQIGDEVSLGKYRQSGDLTSDRESIRWIVLDKKGDKILLISRYALECKPYHEVCEQIDWESSSIREWLNKDFANNAFSEKEKAKVDSVFLLSAEEVEKYFASDKERRCVPTRYAIAQGAYTSNEYSVDGEATCWWWLRSPGRSDRSAAGVYYDGSLNYCGNYVDCDLDCVRPALWINLES